MNFNPYFLPPPLASLRGAGIDPYWTKQTNKPSATPSEELVINEDSSAQALLFSEDSQSTEEVGRFDQVIVLRSTPPSTPKKISLTLAKPEITVRSSSDDADSTEAVPDQFLAVDNITISNLDASVLEEPVLAIVGIDDATQLAVALEQKKETSYEKALISFCVVAEKKSREGGQANYYLGEMHEQGWGVEINLETANAYYQKAKGLGSARASIRLGELSEQEGKLQETKRHYEDALLLSPGVGSAPACSRLAHMHGQGIGIPQDIAQAIQYHQKAIEKGAVAENIPLGRLHRSQGNYEQAFLCYQQVDGISAAQACLELGDFYRTENNLTEAAKCYEAAANKGLTEAYVHHAELYQTLGDLDQAFLLYQKGGEETVAKAFLELGHLFRTASYIENNKQKALTCYQRANEKGCEDAWIALGELHHEKGDDEQAFECFLKGKGDTAAKALVCLGSSYYQLYQAYGTKEIFKKAVQCYLSAEQKGFADARMCLGEMYEADKDFANALDCYQTIDSENASEACRSLGHMCLTQENTEESDIQAISCYTVAAKKGCREAWNDLGKLHRTKGRNQDAEQCFLQAAEQGSVDAWFYVGDLYLAQEIYTKAFTSFQKGTGKNVADGLRKLGDIYKKDACLEKALECYQEAEQKGSIEASNDLGCVYSDRKNYEKAVEYFEKARKQGLAEASNNLGRVYSYGNVPDYGLAMSCFKEAVKRGCLKAYANIGYLFYEGLGVNKNLKEAVKYFLKSEEAGSASACFYLGEFYQQGIEVKQDDAKAIYWYNQAIQRTHSSSTALEERIAELKRKKPHLINDKYEKIFDEHFPLAEAGNAASQYPLGVMYMHNDRYVAQSDTNAEHYLTLAYHHQPPHPRAAFKLGQSFETRRNLRTQDRHKAIEWYKKACESGDGKAVYQAAERLMMIGNKEDQKIALASFRIAANKGNNDAYKNLSYMYYCGLGTEPSEEGALFYYRKYLGNDQATLVITLKKSLLKKGPDDLQITIKSNTRTQSMDEIQFAKFFPLAERGDAEAQLQLGQMYLVDGYVKKNDRTAHDYFVDACKNNPNNAMAVGDIYLKCNDIKSALDWYQQASDAGLGEATYKIALQLIAEESHDRTKTARYLTLALEQGCQEVLKEIVKFSSYCREKYDSSIFKKQEDLTIADELRNLAVQRGYVEEIN